MSIEESKALVRRFYAELDNLNSAVIDELVAENFVNHSPPPFPVEPGREGLKQAFELFRRATPGSHEILDQVAEGDKVVTRLRAVGTHEDDLPGIQRTGNSLEMTATVVHRIENGKIVEKWSDRNELALLQQLGVVSPPALRVSEPAARPRCAERQRPQAGFQAHRSARSSSACVARTDDDGWSLCGAPWSQPVVETDGRSHDGETASDKPKPLPWVPTGCRTERMSGSC